MIVLYTETGPNPFKVSIALEELGLPYRVEEVDVWKGGGQTPEFLALNPNGKVPVIRDEENGQVVFESNAILLYLAEKAGRLFPRGGPERWRGVQLLFFQAASIGPFFGQRVWFNHFARDESLYAKERYDREGERLERVVDGMLDGREWFLEDYSIVDIAFFGWFVASIGRGFSIDAYPNVKAWYDRVAARPAVQRGIAVPRPMRAAA